MSVLVRPTALGVLEEVVRSVEHADGDVAVVGLVEGGLQGGLQGGDVLGDVDLDVEVTEG